MVYIPFYQVYHMLFAVLMILPIKNRKTNINKQYFCLHLSPITASQSHLPAPPLKRRAACSAFRHSEVGPGRLAPFWPGWCRAAQSRWFGFISRSTELGFAIFSAFFEGLLGNFSHCFCVFWGFFTIFWWPAPSLSKSKKALEKCIWLQGQLHTEAHAALTTFKKAAQEAVPSLIDLISF